MTQPLATFHKPQTKPQPSQARLPNPNSTNQAPPGTPKGAVKLDFEMLDRAPLLGSAKVGAGLQPGLTSTARWRPSQINRGLKRSGFGEDGDEVDDPNNGLSIVKEKGVNGNIKFKVDDPRHSTHEPVDQPSPAFAQVTRQIRSRFRTPEKVESYKSEAAIDGVFKRVEYETGLIRDDGAQVLADYSTSPPSMDEPSGRTYQRSAVQQTYPTQHEADCSHSPFHPLTRRPLHQHHSALRSPVRSHPVPRQHVLEYDPPHHVGHDFSHSPPPQSGYSNQLARRPHISQAQQQSFLADALSNYSLLSNFAWLYPDQQRQLLHGLRMTREALVDTQVLPSQEEIEEEEEEALYAGNPRQPFVPVSSQTTLLAPPPRAVHPDRNLRHEFRPSRSGQTTSADHQRWSYPVTEEGSPAPFPDPPALSPDGDEVNVSQAEPMSGFWKKATGPPLAQASANLTKLVTRTGLEAY